MGLHHFAISKNGVSGMLSVRGKAAEIVDLTKELEKREIAFAEVEQYEANTLRDKIEDLTKEFNKSDLPPMGIKPVKADKPRKQEAAEVKPIRKPQRKDKGAETGQSESDKATNTMGA